MTLPRPAPSAGFVDRARRGRAGSPTGTPTPSKWLRQVMTIPRRVISAVRYANHELLRANEAIFRPPGAHRSRPPASAPAAGSAHPPAKTQHARPAA